MFLETFHQACFGIPRRRLGKPLPGVDALRAEPVAGLQSRQKIKVLFHLIVIDRDLIDLHETVENQHLAPGRELFRGGGRSDADRGFLQTGVGHLRGDGPLPDQIVEAGHGAVALDLRSGWIGGSYGLVGLLGALGARFVLPGFGMIGAVTGGDEGFQAVERRGREMDRVRSHVGDVPFFV